MLKIYNSHAEVTAAERGFFNCSLANPAHPGGETISSLTTAAVAPRELLLVKSFASPHHYFHFLLFLLQFNRRYVLGRAKRARRKGGEETRQNNFACLLFSPLSSLQCRLRERREFSSSPLFPFLFSRWPSSPFPPSLLGTPKSAKEFPRSSI